MAYVRDIPERPHGAPAESWQFMSWVDLLWRRFCDDKRHHVGTFTVDMASATGTQSVTGVGFTPRALIVAGSNLGQQNSIGATDGNASYCIYDDSNVTADQWGFAVAIAYFEGSGGVNYTLQFSSFDPDGFTVAKTKGGAATGDAFLWYLALR